MPNEDIASARLMVKPVGNIYFAVNPSNFSIKKYLAVSNNNVKSFAIFPNPAKNEVNVSLKNKSENGIYMIYDATGRMVKNGFLVTY